MGNPSISRTLVPATGFGATIKQKEDTQGFPAPAMPRNASFPIMLRAPAYALALGPRCTFDEIMLVRGGEIGDDIELAKRGPLREGEVIIVSANRPWIGLIPEGLYRAYFRRPPPRLNVAMSFTPTDDWWGNQAVGPEWILTGSPYVSAVVVTGTQPKPIMMFDLIAYHDPVWLGTLPQGRSPHVVTARYRVDDPAAPFGGVGATPYSGLDTPWHVALIPVEITFLVHAQGRRRFSCAAASSAGDVQWTVSVDGVRFSNAGDMPNEIVNVLSSAIIDSTTAPLDFALTSWGYDGYRVRTSGRIKPPGEGGSNKAYGIFDLEAKVED